MYFAFGYEDRNASMIFSEALWHSIQCLDISANLCESLFFFPFFFFFAVTQRTSIIAEFLYISLIVHIS